MALIEGPCAARFYRQFFALNTCRTYSHTTRPLTSKLPLSRHSSKRHAGSYSRRQREEEEEKNTGAPWVKRPTLLPASREAEFKQCDLVTSADLLKKPRRPRRTKMLMRDFIEDSLYNPTYGYFSDQVVIFDPGEPFKFNELRDEADFNRVLGERYTAFEDNLDKKKENDTRQLWHTPTELFRPHYAEAMARYLVSNYKISSIYPWHDLVIYELGAGNGTFMLNVLDYIRDTDPDVYDRTQYKIIEISPALAALQRGRLTNLPDSHATHASKVEIVNRSIFEWKQYVSSPCFFLAMEVIDNFAHDAVRYSSNGDPLQSTVFIDSSGEFYEFYSPTLDPLASRYFRVRDAACGGTSLSASINPFQPLKYNAHLPLTHPLRWRTTARNLRSKLPFAPNLSPPEWIPTRLLQFFDVLQTYFPAHRLLLSDFHELKDAVEGVNAPVVQTRYKRRTVPVSTPLVCHYPYLTPPYPYFIPRLSSIIPAAYI